MNQQQPTTTRTLLRDGRDASLRSVPMILKALAAALVAMIAAVGLASPASAASVVQPANCNYNYNTGIKSIVVRAPHVYSNNGTTQWVRYRSYLRKWNGSAWVVPSGAIGQWHQGTATPNSPFIGPGGTWTTKTAYGAGYYQVGIQVQYYNGAWGGQTTQVVGTYYQNTYYSGAWHYEGNVPYCTHF